MMSTETTINVQISDHYAKELAEYNESLSAGAARAIIGFIDIRKNTLNEIKGLFTKEELLALTTARHALELSPEYKANQETLIAYLKDYEMSEEGISSYGASIEILEHKIREMAATQVYILLDEIHRFWNNGPKDLFEFVAIHTD